MKSHNWRYRFTASLVIAWALTFKMEANASENFLESCPIKAGDSVEQVKEFFKITEDPTHSASLAPGGPSYTYHFPAYGIYIFFDDAKLVRTLRFEPPFTGKVEGVSIGDSKDQILKLKGEPTKRFRGFYDSVALDARRRRKFDILDSLPDPAPKELVRKAFAEIAAIDRLPYPFAQAWAYTSNERRLLRYDLSEVNGKVLMVFTDKGPTQSSAPVTAASEVNSVVEDRLRNARVTERRLTNGAVIREYKFAGSLQPNADLGCISIREVTSEFNPPALIYAAKKCIQQEQYAKAWALLTTGYGFAYYDLKRLADRSTQGARSVLTMNAFADLTDMQREKASKIGKELQTDPEQVKAYCSELARIGPPTYEPQWAILHGIGAYHEPHNGPYLTNVDSKALWEEVLRNRCTPQRS